MVKKQWIVVVLLCFACLMQHSTLLAWDACEEDMNDQNVALVSRDVKIVAISASAASGDLPALRVALTDGLDAGLTVSEIKEVLVQLYAYCGFPRSLNALETFRILLLERQAAGILDSNGCEPNPLPEGQCLDFGTKNQTQLCGTQVNGPLFEFAPAIDMFLKSHLFGDIFGRDNLDWQTRELATIAALTVMDGVQPQLDAHIQIGKHNGLSDAQITDIFKLAKRTTIQREETHETQNMDKIQESADVFPKGEKLESHFTGDAWVAFLVNEQKYDLGVYNVTFAPATRNDWHSHSVGQILLCTVGTGYYQERGQTSRRLQPGDVVEIPANVEHWHGAAPDCTFVHVGMTPKMTENQTVWLEPVTDSAYREATSGDVLNAQ